MRCRVKWAMHDIVNVEAQVDLKTLEFWRRELYGVFLEVMGLLLK